MINNLVKTLTIFLIIITNGLRIYEVRYIEKFLDSIDVNIQRVNSKEFQSNLDNYNFTSVSQQNQVINADTYQIKF